MLCVSSDLSAVVGVVFRGVRVGHVPQMQLKSRHEKSGLARFAETLGIAEMCIAESKCPPKPLSVCEVGDYPGFPHSRSYSRSYSR